MEKLHVSAYSGHLHFLTTCCQNLKTYASEYSETVSIENVCILVNVSHIKSLFVSLKNA